MPLSLVTGWSMAGPPNQGAISALRRPSAVAAAARWWLRSARSSCASRLMPFSLAIFSADCPMDSPVEGSAIAGVTGTRARGRVRPKADRRAPKVFARLASTSTRVKRREWRMGMSESDSTPPARIVSAWPSAIWSAALLMAWALEAQARFRVYAGTLGRSCGRRLTSRPTLGARTDGTT
jgi:hypothetical protein